MSHKSVIPRVPRQECHTQSVTPRVSHKSVISRVFHKGVPSSVISKVFHQGVPQDKSVSQKCLIRVSPKNVLQDVTTAFPKSGVPRVSYKSAQLECHSKSVPTRGSVIPRVSCKRVPTSVSQKSVPLECHSRSVPTRAS